MIEQVLYFYFFYLKLNSFRDQMRSGENTNKLYSTEILIVYGCSKTSLSLLHITFEYND